MGQAAAALEERQAAAAADLAAREAALAAREEELAGAVRQYEAERAAAEEADAREREAALAELRRLEEGVEEAAAQLHAAEQEAAAERTRLDRVLAETADAEAARDAALLAHQAAEQVGAGRWARHVRDGWPGLHAALPLLALCRAVPSADHRLPPRLPGPCRPLRTRGRPWRKLWQLARRRWPRWVGGRAGAGAEAVAAAAALLLRRHAWEGAPGCRQANKPPMAPWRLPVLHRSRRGTTACCQRWRLPAATASAGSRSRRRPRRRWPPSAIALRRRPRRRCGCGGGGAGAGAGAGDCVAAAPVLRTDSWPAHPACLHACPACPAERVAGGRPAAAAGRGPGAGGASAGARSRVGRSNAARARRAGAAHAGAGLAAWCVAGGAPCCPGTAPVQLAFWHCTQAACCCLPTPQHPTARRSWRLRRRGCRGAPRSWAPWSGASRRRSSAWTARRSGSRRRWRRWRRRARHSRWATAACGDCEPIAAVEGKADQGCATRPTVCPGPTRPCRSAPTSWRRRRRAWRPGRRSSRRRRCARSQSASAC